MLRIFVLTLTLLTLPSLASAQADGGFGLQAPQHGHCRSGHLVWHARLGPHGTVRCVYQPPPYRGPWDAAHMPPTIANAGVKLTLGRDYKGNGHLTLSLSQDLWCPHNRSLPITVTFSYPAGWTSEALGASGSCHPGTWTAAFRSGGRIEFPKQDRRRLGSAPLEFRLSPARPRVPVLLEVSGPAGIIAEHAFTVVEHFTPWQNGVDYTIFDVTRCRHEHLKLRIERGRTFCTQHAGGQESVPIFSIVEGGWA